MLILTPEGWRVVGQKDMKPMIWMPKQGDTYYPNQQYLSNCAPGEFNPIAVRDFPAVY